MPEAEPEEEEGQHAAAVLIQDGAADHHGRDHAAGAGEQNGIAHHEGNGIAEPEGEKPDKPATHSQDFAVRHMISPIHRLTQELSPWHDCWRTRDAHV